MVQELLCKTIELLKKHWKSIILHALKILFTKSTVVDLLSNKLIISYGHSNSILQEVAIQLKDTLSTTKETGEIESSSSTTSSKE